MPGIKAQQTPSAKARGPGHKPVEFPARPGRRPGAISVGTVPVIAIPGAANSGRVAMISGRTASPRCNQSGHDTPMIAIPATGYCGSLHLPGASARGFGAHIRPRPSRGRTHAFQSIGGREEVRVRCAPQRIAWQFGVDVIFRDPQLVEAPLYSRELQGGGGWTRTLEWVV